MQCELNESHSTNQQQESDFIHHKSEELTDKTVAEDLVSWRDVKKAPIWQYFGPNAYRNLQRISCNFLVVVFFITNNNEPNIQAIAAPELALI